jgi:hypothetical protein
MSDVTVWVLFLLASYQGCVWLHTKRNANSLPVWREWLTDNKPPEFETTRR